MFARFITCFTFSRFQKCTFFTFNFGTETKFIFNLFFKILFFHFSFIIKFNRFHYFHNCVFLFFYFKSRRTCFTSISLIAFITIYHTFFTFFILYEITFWTFVIFGYYPITRILFSEEIIVTLTTFVSSWKFRFIGQSRAGNTFSFI